jgi:hypothetical protein
MRIPPLDYIFSCIYRLIPTDSVISLSAMSYANNANFFDATRSLAQYLVACLNSSAVLLVYNFHNLTTIYSFYLLAVWRLEMGPTDCSETSVINYGSTLCNIQRKRCSNLRSDGKRKSRKFISFYSQ